MVEENRRRRPRISGDQWLPNKRATRDGARVTGCTIRSLGSRPTPHPQLQAELRSREVKAKNAGGTKSHECANPGNQSHNC